MLGVPLIILGLFSSWIVASPDILVAADGRAMALRRADGAIAMRMVGKNDFLRELWLRRAGLETAEPWSDGGVSGVVGCGDAACWIDRPEGLIAVVTAPRELSTACAHATVLVTALEIWRPCPGPLWVVDRATLRLDGAHAIWLGDTGLPRITSVRGVRGSRPWVRPPPASSAS